MLDLRRLARARSIPTVETGHTHCRPGWIQLQCPFCGRHGSHGGWYLGFSTEFGNFHCWRCGTLRFWDVVCRLLRLDKGAARAVVAEFQVHRQAAARVPVMRQRQLKPPPGFGPLLPAHRRYLRGRGFDPDALAETWQVGGCGPTSGPWAWRVVFPVKNREDRTVAWQGRTIGRGEPKYRLTDDADCLEDPATFLYGIEHVEDDAVIVVEGATGVWRLGPGAVAMLGIDWKPAKAFRLRAFKRRFILFDPEPKAQARAHGLAELLGVFPGVTEVLSGFATDPGEFSERLVAKVRRVALG